MKLKLYLPGVTVEYEKAPMPESRFRALCLLAGAGMYGGMIYGVTALCDLPGLVIIVAVSVLLLLILKE